MLDISHNHIEVVPEAVAHLSALSHLDLSRNWLNGSSLGRLSGLTQLKVGGGSIYMVELSGNCLDGGVAEVVAPISLSWLDHMACFGG